MNFYLIIPVRSVEIGGRFTKYKTTGASIYHIYMQNKTEYNVFCPSSLLNRYPWPRKKLTRKTLAECFHLSLFYKNIKADNINELVMEINMHSKIYKIVT